ncbi:efflux RND transporter periplasmic adaptor subunit [Actinoplanes sp. G11-F43]|uniref:efflux RND transporter periplasmic adaptor subunit n=1 Tax=Actinoplanes sp. G11-F43 TaxID=3424130 RepID=UPI003D35719A
MGVVLAGRRRQVWLAVVAVVVVVLTVGAVRALTAGAGAEGPAAVETVAVDKGAVTTEVATTGTLQAAQTRSLSFAVSATVESVRVRAGNTVTAGQVLATVDGTAAAERVDDAAEALADARERLTEARTTSTSVTGCDVAAGYTTSVSPSPSVSPSAAPAGPSPSVTTAAPAPSRTVTTTPSRPAATKTCGASRSGGGDAVLSAEQRVNAAQVTLAEAEEALAGATITAPIAGRILTVSGKVGAAAKAGSTFITLADVYDMQIGASFPEADADRLAVAQKAVVTLADRAGETFAATVVQVDPVGTSDGTLTRFGVLLSFDEAPKELLVGQSAGVRVTTGSKENVLRVPSTAVHGVRGEDGTVLRDGAEVAVKLGLRGDRYTEIVSGVSEADSVARSW